MAIERLRRVLLFLAVLLGALAMLALFVQPLIAIVLAALAGLFGWWAWPGRRTTSALPAHKTEPAVAVSTPIEPVAEFALIDASPPIAQTQPPRPGWTLALLGMAGTLVLGILIGAAGHAALNRAGASALTPDTSPLALLPAQAGLVPSTIVLDGETIETRHSALDMGEIQTLFDGNRETLVRGRDANPFIFEVRYSQPRPARAVMLDLARMSDFKSRCKPRRVMARC